MKRCIVIHLKHSSKVMLTRPVVTSAVSILQVIRTNTKLPRPSGILWHKLSPQKLGQIRVLRELKQRIEEETGQQLPSGMV